MDGNKLRVHDEDNTGKVLNVFEIDFEAKMITVRDIITERVFQEVNECVAAKRKYALVLPHSPIALNHEEEVTKALQAFEQNQFFILVNNRQVEDLDESISLTDTTTVSFLRLLPIVGG